MKALPGSIAMVMGISSACDGGKPPADPRQTVLELPATPTRDLDLLFVVDDSPGMLEAQLNLKNSFHAFLDQLARAPGGFPNLHLGIVSTDMGTKASGSATPGPAIGQLGNGGCAATGKGGALQIGQSQLADRFLIDVALPGGGRMTNYTEPLLNAFGKMVSLGAGGCGFEQPLAAMRAALDGNAANAGFLRADAMLGVVFLADEDDCSAQSTNLFGPESPTLGPLQSFRCTRFGVTCAQGGRTEAEMNQAGLKGECTASASSTLVDDIAPYRDFLAGLKSDPMRLAVAGIVAPPEPVAVELRSPPGGGSPISGLAHACTFDSPFGIVVADPAVRLHGFIGELGGRSAAPTICQQDLSGPLRDIGKLLLRGLGHACVDAPLADADPATPGLDADCAVEEVQPAMGLVRELEPCEATGGAKPCWRLEADAATCADAPAPHLRLVVERTELPPPGVRVRVSCLVDG